MIKFRLPFGNKKSADSESLDDWFKDYIGDYDDDDEDDEEDEDDYPYIAFDYAEGLFDDEDTSESIDASDASFIWMSHGKDEDYMFGYSEDELENA